MKVVLISMRDVAPIIIHERAIHMPNHGIACGQNGWGERYKHYISRLEKMNNFEDLKKYERGRESEHADLRKTGGF